MEKQRTIQQNKALHLMYRMLAEQLNLAGLDIRAVLKPGVEIPWSENAVKEYLWRPVQRIVLGKESTTELTTTDIDKVANVLIHKLAEKFGIEVEFPSVERLIHNEKPPLP